MRYAVFSDVHSNLEAFDAVLDFFSRSSVNRYIFLGDIVGYGANPSECLALVKESVQEIIDLIAAKQNKSANNKLVEVSDILDELLDFSEEDEDLIEISKYQVLLNQLHQKINTAE